MTRHGHSSPANHRNGKELFTIKLESLHPSVLDLHAELTPPMTVASTATDVVGSPAGVAFRSEVVALIALVGKAKQHPRKMIRCSQGEKKRSVVINQKSSNIIGH